MLSLRQRANCVGLPGDFSVLRDFFGYSSTPPWKLSVPQQLLPQSLSVRTQLERLAQKHFHMNIIRVGTDAAGFLPAVDEQNVDCAAQLTRDIYASIGIGVGRVDRGWMIPQPTHYAVIDNDDEADDLVDEYSCKNGYIDVFFVLDYVGSVCGLYPWKGDGVVVESLEKQFFQTGWTMAHELGHYFGLDHINNAANLMNPTVGNWFPQINTSQAQKVASQDAMHPAC